MNLLRNAFEEISSPLCKVRQAGLQHDNWQGEKLQHHPMLAVLATDAPKLKSLSFLMHGCQTDNHAVDVYVTRRT